MLFGLANEKKNINILPLSASLFIFGKQNTSKFADNGRVLAKQ